MSIVSMCVRHMANIFGKRNSSNRISWLFRWRSNEKKAYLVTYLAFEAKDAASPA